MLQELCGTWEGLRLPLGLSLSSLPALHTVSSGRWQEPGSWGRGHSTPLIHLHYSCILGERWVGGSVGRDPGGFHWAPLHAQVCSTPGPSQLSRTAQSGTHGPVSTGAPPRQLPGTTFTTPGLRAALLLPIPLRISLCNSLLSFTLQNTLHFLRVIPVSSRKPSLNARVGRSVFLRAPRHPAPPR